MKLTGWLKQRAWPIAIVTLVLCVMLVVLDEVEKHQLQVRQQAKPTGAVLPVVSVTQVKPRQLTLDVKVLARLKPRYQSLISSQVDGHIVGFSERLQEGVVVEAGEALLQLDDSEYQAQLDQAKMEHAQAQVAFLTEQRMARQASRDWQRSNQGQPDSPLVLRQPQLEAAKMTEQAARTNLKRAETLLSYTRIESPYRAVVLKRHVNPGEMVGSGQALVEIMSVDEFELVVALNDKQWQLLADDWQHRQARLRDPLSGQVWQAGIRNAGYFYDNDTQLRNLYLSMANQGADGGLLPGRLLEVSLPGQQVQDVLQIPESAYTRDAHIWLLGQDNRLEKMTPEILAVMDDSLVVRPPGQSPGTFRIALFPQSQFTVGLKVNPTEPDSLNGNAAQVAALSGAIQ
ncbi:efflux RND transporter periplasmic adaptor subunit [Bowmanella denitrificans]|uniref:efflux RND transporter periplasmic adaptor subunit n=1 Tax=Bowmanella denitrificans TaxID=366582 RepID=UPI000C9A7FDA|nr:efflux RND transporter periplasmic adaptor subunit [Bowmanella denitrificans]